MNVPKLEVVQHFVEDAVFFGGSISLGLLSQQNQQINCIGSLGQIDLTFAAERIRRLPQRDNR